MAKGKSSGIFDSSGENRKKLRASVGEKEIIAYRKENIELEKKEIKQLQKRISLSKKSAELKKQEQAQLEKQLETVGKLSDEEYDRYDSNEKFLKQLESEEKILENRRKNLSRLKKIEDDRVQSFEKILSTNEELDDINTSIANKFGKQSKLAEKIGIITDQTLKTHKVSASIIDSMKDTTEKKRAIELNEAFKQRTISIASASNELAKGKISQEEYNSIIIQAKEMWEDVLSKMKLTSPEAKALADTMKSATVATDSFYNSTLKSQKVLQGMDMLMGEFSGIPAMREFGELIKTNKNNTLAFRVALFALGAAAGKALYDYFGALDKIQRLAPFEKDIAQLEGQNQIREKQIELSKVDGKIRVDNAQELASVNESIFKAQWDAANASKRAASEFNAQIQQSALQFRTASKTALFGDKLGGVGYGAAQMEMAGVSADRVAESMKTTGNVMGKMPTSKVASDMAVMATRTGATDESLASLTHMFMDIDGLSMSTAVNMEDGLAAMAKSLNIPMDAFINEMAEASKEMLGYQIKSGPALAKQVAYAKSLGVSFSDIAKAGQNMVLNYKDSIKSEMQLSAMLGKQVDLSEVRSKFAMGDTKGALEALKAQGLNPAEMDMFQQQALQQATGMDLQTLRNIYTGEGRTANLKEGSAATNNRQFLGRVESAQREQAIGSANISANQAVFSAELEKKITEEYFNKILNPQSEADKLFSKQAFDLEKQKTDAEIKAINQSIDVKVATILDPTMQSLKARLEQANQELDYFKIALSGAAGLAGGFASSVLGELGGKVLGKGFDVLGKKAMKGPAGKLLQKVIPSFGNVTTNTAAPIVTKRGITLQRNIVANEAKDLALQSASKNVASKSASIVSKIGVKSIGKSLVKGLVKGGPTGILSTAASMAGDYFGGQREAEGMAEGDRSKVNTGKAMKAGATALEYAGYGAVIGSIIPGVGTAIGAGVGGIVGGIKGIWDNWYSDEAKIQDEKLKSIEEENARKEAAAAAAAAANMMPNQSVSQTSTDDSVNLLNQIKINDHVRGISMYAEMQKQTNQLRVVNGQLVKTVDRVHKANDNLTYLNNNRMAELININKNIQTLQEANVELMTLLVKNAQIPAEVTLDGKLVGKKLGDMYQSSRTIAF